MTSPKKILDGFQEKTRIEATKEQYLLKAKQLYNKAKKELGLFIDDELDVRQFVVWLVEKKPTIARTTWRFHKSAVIYFLENHPNTEASIEAISYLKEINSVGALKKTERTSSLKLKHITLEDWFKLDNYLDKKNGKWHQQLRSWLRASLITGLRPIEWENALFFIYEGQPALKIKNAKNTNGRAHGETRTLILNDVLDVDLNIIKQHLNNVRTFSGMGEYEYFYRGCAIALYKASRRCWPRRKRHITLYSTRHQFSANAKSSGFSRLEVAAMMGHAVDITANIHYARKTGGNEKTQISPIQEEVNKVREITSTDFKNFIKTGTVTTLPKTTNSDILADLLGDDLIKKQN